MIFYISIFKSFPSLYINGPINLAMKHANKIISVRFSISDANLLNEVLKNRGQDVSDFVRLSVRKELARLSFLTTEEKKALEIIGR